MKRKIIGILVCMLLFAPALAMAMPTNKIVTSLTPVPFPINGNKGIPSVSPIEQLSLLLGKTVYGCNCFWYNKTLVSCTLDNPGNIHNITNAASSYFLSGGCWVDGAWWACEFSYYESNNSKIWKINPTTGEMTLIGLSGFSIDGLDYDDTTGIMYASSGSSLYTIDMVTGRATKVGNFGMAISGMIGIACDSVGNLYGEAVGIPGSLYAINKTSGKANLIGHFTVNLSYAQDMAFDKDTDKLYLAACVLLNQTTVENALYYCDHHTAALTKIGIFGNETIYPLVEIDAFAIPYTSKVNLSIQIKGGLGVKAIIKNTGTINISGYPWQLYAKGGILGKINKTVNGTISLKVGESQTVTMGMLFGFGSLSITTQVADVEKTAKGTQILFLSMVK